MMASMAGQAKDDQPLHGYSPTSSFDTANVEEQVTVAATRPTMACAAAAPLEMQLDVMDES